MRTFFFLAYELYKSLEVGIFSNYKSTNISDNHNLPQKSSLEEEKADQLLSKVQQY